MQRGRRRRLRRLRGGRLKVRAARLADVAEAVAVVRRSITELCVEEYRGDPAVLARWLANKTEDSFRRWIEDDRHALFVADAQPGVAGVGMMTTDGEVQLDYVSPDFRFSGVSKALLAAMEAHARTLGLAEVRLLATCLAQPMYASCGYETLGEAESQFGTLPGFRMCKSLGAPTGAGSVIRARPS